MMVDAEPLDGAWRDARTTGSPSMEMLPASGAISSPFRIFTMVDLPAPFWPISPCTLPRATTRIGAVERAGRAEDLHQAAHLECLGTHVKSHRVAAASSPFRW